MGLDMFLCRAKRLGGATAEEVSTLEGYYGYLERGEDYKSKTLEEWCGIKECEVPLQLVDVYKSEYTARYFSWDKEKQHPFNCIFETVGYWRKANAIHRWFVENVQNGIDECQISEVTKDQLLELSDLCQKVLCNNELAEELLPIQKGFFFGNEYYDKWYYESLKDTIKIIDTILKTTDFDKEMIAYQASW